MDAQREREHLVEADRHIARAKRQIDRQKQLVEELPQNEHETIVAKSSLHAMEHSLHGFEQHREVIVDTLKTEGGVWTTSSGRLWPSEDRHEARAFARLAPKLVSVLADLGMTGARSALRSGPIVGMRLPCGTDTH